MREQTGNGVRGQDLPARKPAIIFGCTWDGLSEKRTAEGRRLVRVVDTEARSAKRRGAMRVGNSDGAASIWRHREAPIGRGYLFTTIAAAAVRRLASVSDGDSPMTSAYICAKRPKCENPSSSATLVTLVSAVA